MKPNPTVEVNPSAASLKALAAASHTGPIAMLNLLRYAGDTGRARYGTYAAVAQECIAAVGGSLIYLGRVLHPDSWDTVAIVYYPSPQAFLNMQADDRYIAAISDRTAGLRARLLFPFALPDISGDEAAVGAVTTSDEVVVVRLTQRLLTAPPAPQDPPSSLAPTMLPMAAVGEGLVADESWDAMQLVRFPSAQVAQQDQDLAGSRGNKAFVVRSEPAELL